MPFGLINTQYIDFVEQQTEAFLRGTKTRAGLSVEQMVTRADQAMRAANAPDPLVTALTYRTERDRIPGDTIGTKVWQRSSEHSVARPQRGQRTTGHLLPLHHNEMALGFTYRGLQEISLEMLTEEFRSTVGAIRTGKRADVLERLFDPGVLPIDDDGTAGTPGFAGSGTDQYAFVGRLPGGGVTASDYTHYGYTDAAGLEEALDTFLARIKQFHAGPFDMIAPDAIVDLVKQIKPGEKFVPTGSNLVRPAETDAEALVDPNVYVGVYDGVLRIRHGDPQIQEGEGSTNALAIVKIYGPNNPSNALAWRYDPLYGQNVFIEDRDLYPLVNASILQPYGVGVNRRTGAALISVGTGQSAYTKPTIVRV